MITQQINRDAEYPRVAIIILNWNGWKDTIECLESVLQITYPNYQIIVVDNGSDDDSIEKIKSWAQGEIHVESSFFESDLVKKPIKLIEYDQDTISDEAPVADEKINKNSNGHSLTFLYMKENLGFAGGNNLGIVFALRDPEVQYLWLLNNDTIAPAETLAHLVNESMRNPRVGILSPKICYYSCPDRIWFAGGKLGYLRAAGYNLSLDMPDSAGYGDLVPCTFITGCSMLIKRKLIETVGLLDPFYFLYDEDVDFSWRAIKDGWDLCTYLDSVIYHKVSSSTAKGPRYLQTYYISRNRPYFSAKFHTRLQRIAFSLFWISSRATKFFIWITINRIDLIKATMQGYIDYRKGKMGIM